MNYLTGGSATILIALLLYFFLPFHHHDEKVDLFADGSLVTTLSLTDLSTHPASQIIQVKLAHEKFADIPFRAVPALDLLSSLFGARLSSQDALAFICSDGYRYVAHQAQLRQDQAYLAYARADQGHFYFRNFIADPKGGKTQEAGPLFLVWQSKNSETLAHTSTASWPFQIVKIEVVPPTKDLAAIPVPRPDAALELRQGYEVYRQRCMSCHGSSEEIAPSIFIMAKTVQKQGKHWLGEWTKNPQALKPGAKMPALALESKHLEEVYQYLQFIP